MAPPRKTTPPTSTVQVHVGLQAHDLLFPSSGLDLQWKLQPSKQGHGSLLDGGGQKLKNAACSPGPLTVAGQPPASGRSSSNFSSGSRERWGPSCSLTGPPALQAPGHEGAEDLRTYPRPRGGGPAARHPHWPAQCPASRDYIRWATHSGVPAARPGRPPASIDKGTEGKLRTRQKLTPRNPSPAPGCM